MPNQTDARKHLSLPAPFRLRRGGSLPRVSLAYETWGTLNAQRDNALLIFTGLSPGAHACASPEDPSPGWWEDMVGPGQPIDTNRYHVLCFNSLGSCKGSTGPASVNPETDRAWRMDFPDLELQDIANAVYLALRQLGIEHLAAVVGPSMGGMTALALLLEHPDVSRNLVCISSAVHAEPFSIAIRSLQRETILQDPNWQDGRYGSDGHPVQGMRLARKIGMLSYRSAAEWRTRFQRHRIPPERRNPEPFGAEFEIESYLQTHADRFIDQFDPACYLYLSRAMDWFDAGDYAADAATALAELKLHSALVIGVDSDILFPLHQQQLIADALQQGGARVAFHDLPSIQGHDSFLVDMEHFAPPVRAYFESLGEESGR